MDEAFSGRGRVAFWKADVGWGEITLPDGNACFGHFSVIAMPGFRMLESGQEVDVLWHAARQDGYAYAASEIRP